MTQKNSRFVKGTLITFLAGAITVNYMKKLIFGSPPSKLRQYIVFGTLGGLFAYNKLGIDEYYQDYKERINDSRLEQIANLQELTENKKETIHALNLQNQNERNRVLDLTERLNKEISKNKHNPKVPVDSDFWYVVKKGETVRNISDKIYGSNIQANNIITLNGLTQPDNMLQGTPLKVPDEGIINYRVLNEKNFPARYVRIKKGEKLRTVIHMKTGDYRAGFVNEVRQYNIERGNYIEFGGLFGKNAKNTSKLYLPK